MSNNFMIFYAILVVKIYVKFRFTEVHSRITNAVQSALLHIIIGWPLKTDFTFTRKNVDT